MRRIKFSIVCGMAATLLAGCGGLAAEAPPVQGGSLESLAKAAKDEGSLVLYSAEVQSDIDRITHAFTAKYGIPVEVVRLATGELNQRFSAEAAADSTAADVLIGTDPRIYAQNAEWFAPLDDHDVPGLGAYPKSSVTKNSYASLLYVFSIAYNSTVVEQDDAPKSWEDLLKPSLAGKLLMNDPRATPAYISWLDAMQKRFGDSFLRRIGAAHPALAPTASTGAQQVAAGESAANFPSQPHQTIELVASGAPIGNNAVSDPPIAYGNYLGIAAKAAHPNAARLFAAWRLTDAGQKVICEGKAYATPISGPERGCLGLPQKWELIQPVDEARTSQLLDLVGLSG